MVSNAACQFSSLSLNGLRLKVKLGCEEVERQAFQYVRFDVHLRFDKLPAGCLSDRLDQTVCYAEISQRLHEVCFGREYHLIEKLAWEAYSILKNDLPEGARLWIRATKEKPPIENELQGGASFCLGDWDQS